MDCLLMVAKRGLWSVKRVKGRPSRKNLKCLTGKEGGQEFSVKSGIVGFCCRKFFGEKGKGLPRTIVFCWRTAPTWEFEASVARWPKRILHFESKGSFRESK